MLKIYDTKLREMVELKPEKDNTIRMYTCGPTVYDFAHIGNLRTYVFEDLLRRAIKYFGMEIFHVMNITDVDDKTIRRANEEGLPLREYTKKYTEAFFQDLETLSIERAESYPAATDHIDEMIAMIQKLIDLDVAYVSEDGNVFFRVSKFKDYGKLSHLCLDELKEGASKRVDSDEYDKETVSDFVLWKAYDPKRDGQVKWDAPFGVGRPGWHIECSAMATKVLGETIDLHVGGVDNIFPHHENEIAQSEACTGKTFSRFWMHSSHLIVDGKKMSKSLGNFYTLRNLLDEGYTGREVRYLLLSTHYRTQLNFTKEGLKAAQNSIGRIDDFRVRLQGIEGEDRLDVSQLLADVQREFDQELGEDLNISAALACLFTMIRNVNTLCDTDQIGKSGAEAILRFMKSVDAVLGVLEPQAFVVPSWIEEALVKRKEAREDKNWQLADEIRDKIEAAGFEIEDGGKGGARVKPKCKS